MSRLAASATCSIRNYQYLNISSLIKLLVQNRLKAFVIDYLVILGYIVLLAATTLLLSSALSLNLQSLSLLSAQLLGFSTLTLPVILYFTLMEKSRQQGTIGKKKYHLQVVGNNLTKAGFGQLLLRNCIKFLPWELAHYFIYRLFYYTRQNTDPPGWVLTGLILSQALALLYLAVLIFNKNNCTVYESLSATKVIRAGTTDQQP